MKFTSAFVFLLFSVTNMATALSVSSADDAAAAVAQCGDLGIMQMPDVLPEGVNKEDIRTCAEHPLGRNNTIVGLELFERATEASNACVKNAPGYGCDGGFCWKVCGDHGEWCWTAANFGFGDWLKCSTLNDCGTTNFACGQGCVTSKSCGCSC